MKKFEIRLGKEGYRELREFCGMSFTYDKIYEWLGSKVRDRLRGVADFYESAIDVQLGILARDLLSVLKENRIYDKVVVWYYEKDQIGEEKDNPPASLKALARKSGKSLKTLERYWKETKDYYLERTGKTEDELTDEDYQYIMGVVKKRAGLPVKSVRKRRR